MSAYGKAPPQPQLHSYEANRTYSEQPYPYAPAIYSGQPTVPLSAPGYQHVNQPTSMAYPNNQVRTPYDTQAGPYLNVGSASLPEVTSFQPQSGKWNTKINVFITSQYELSTPASSPTFSVMFGQRKVPATLQKQHQNDGGCMYQLAADAPQFASTSWSTPNVPLFMMMENSDGEEIGKVNIGDFSYIDSGHPSSSTIAQDGSRKRKISEDEGDDLIRSPAKRLSSQSLRPKEEYAGYQYPSNVPASNFTSYIQPANYGNMPPAYNRPPVNFSGQATPRHLNYAYSTSATASPTVKAQSPQVGTWNASFPPVGSSMVDRPGLPSNGVGIARPSLTSLPSPAAANAPPLIRTSTLQQTPSPATTPHGAHPGQHYNAYALYPHKAKLEISGDLDSMARDWNRDEVEARRRLVHFKRDQLGSTITTTFQPMGAEDRPPNSVCISCIYWEEKAECFVTSVDTIYLLEQLVAARFTVEEKNRIRRNLEGFRPLTVSKAKPDSEEFFKVIMAFPAPKPRNIEKDVKVFHWKDLASALKKIIGKYSASPSSIVQTGPGSLLTPVSSTGYEGAYTADHRTNSPLAINGSSSSYNTTIPPRVLSPPNQKPMNNSGPPDLRIAVPQSTGNWQGAPQQMQQPSQYQQMANPGTRPHWEMNHYMDNHSPAGGPPTGTSAPPFQHPRDVAGVNDLRRFDGGQQMPRT